MASVGEQGLEGAIEAIVARAAVEISSAVRQDIAQLVSRLASGDGATLSLGRKRRVIICPVPECGKPGGGPKWGWCCEEHKNLPEREKEKARRATRARVAKRA
jgi:hypothetical protein